MSKLPIGVWAIARTPLGSRYPCRCAERRFDRCSAAWCPCAGRPDPLETDCCAWWFGPADHVEAMAAWRIKKLQEKELD